MGGLFHGLGEVHAIIMRCDMGLEWFMGVAWAIGVVHEVSHDYRSGSWVWHSG